MSDKYSTMCFCTETYKQHYDYSNKKEVNELEMWDDIKEFMRIAVKNGYQMKVGFDGLTVFIEYDYADESMTGVSLEWVGEDEYIESCSNRYSIIDEADASELHGIEVFPE